MIVTKYYYFTTVNIADAVKIKKNFFMGEQRYTKMSYSIEYKNNEATFGFFIIADKKLLLTWLHRNNINYR